MSEEGTPFSGSRRDLEVDVAPDRASEVATALHDLQRRYPDHPAIVPLIDTGVAQGRPFVVFASMAGDSLDEALWRYGPAEIADALPRLQRVADALDFAAAHRLWHGALTPRDIIISPDDTTVASIGVAAALAGCGITLPPAVPYAAPEVVAQGPISAAVDQFSFAAIAYEWLFGRQISGPADARLDVPTLPNIDNAALARVFAAALARRPAERFDNCSAFVQALTRSARAPELRGSEAPKFWVSGVRESDGHQAPPLADMPIYPSRDGSPEPAVPVISPGLMEESSSPSRGLSRTALAAIMVGAATAAVAVVWFTSRSNEQRRQTTPSPAGQAFTEAAVTPTPATPPASSSTPAADAPAARMPQDARPTGAAPPNTDAVRAAQSDAGLLVHSTPAGAAVTIDGIDRGVTPIAVRGLAYGTRTVVVTRPGYRATMRQVTLTAERPSRTLEVGLVPAAAASQAPAAATDGALVVDSRPAGANVTIDGRPAGVTPLTVEALSPGTHTILIERAGYRPVTTTVQVNAGQRARVAARLEGGREEQ